MDQPLGQFNNLIKQNQMKIKIYVRDECDFCKQVEIPEKINVEKVYVNRDDFEGFKPHNVPIMQLAGINIEGPFAINDTLKVIEDASNGEYNK